MPAVHSDHRRNHGLGMLTSRYRRERAESPIPSGFLHRRMRVG